ncbi:MAG: OmpA family protein [Magnetococcales bacterium]|nr:OmpA family protein [Magnetococcales bacterium]
MRPLTGKTIIMFVGMYALATLTGCATSTKKEGWIATNGYVQWHPQVDPSPLSIIGTQCYFCPEKQQPEQAVAKEPEKSVRAVEVPVAAAPPPPPPPRKCPNPPRGAKTFDADGCWAPKSLHFRFDRTDINPQEYSILDEVVTVMSDEQNRNVKVEVQGHTDSIGGEKYNDGLSLRRANSVQTYLIKRGVQGERLPPKGFGEHQPVAPNDTREGRAQNRRVDLKPQM